jgi:hypothetical protein
LPLLTDSGNWHTVNNSLKLQWEAYSRYRHNNGKPISAISWFGLLLSVICSGHPIELDEPHILALAADAVFLQFKEQVPLKFKKKYQRFNAKGRPFD